jgi:magnesium chelatase subunit I
MVTPMMSKGVEHISQGVEYAYPFAAIVGQEEMKLSLILNAIDLAIGGVMIMGHRGTGKSTAVRALADLLPPIQKVKDCLYGCNPTDAHRLCNDCLERRKKSVKLPRIFGPVPVIDLPLGATEDRVCGTLDIERALTTGMKGFEPGLLARANRGFLYIDEVNLLEDHLVDLLLDTAASGRNVVERESISLSHPARFVLVGSGNPEEGDLRPQLLDRFGLHAQITTVTDLDLRVRIVELREQFEQDPAKFCAKWRVEQELLRRHIVNARRLVKKIDISRELLRRVAELCLTLKIEGHRGELTIARAARALAAFEGRATVTPVDISRIAVISLRHRLRKDPLDSIDSGLRIEQAVGKIFPLPVRQDSADSFPSRPAAVALKR